METKRCSKCKEQKAFSEFSKDKSRKDGYCSKCKACAAECNAEYRKNNKTEIAAYKAEHFQKNKNEITEHKVEYQRNRRKIDSLFKFSCIVRTLITGSFSRQGKFKKNTKTEQLLGCSITELRAHIAKQFLPGMSLENHGEWHIDHIVPLASARTQEDIERLCHYTNLQPMWAVDNLKKGKRMI